VLAEHVVSDSLMGLDSIKTGTRNETSPEGFPINDPTPGPLLPDTEDPHGKIE